MVEPADHVFGCRPDRVVGKYQLTDPIALLSAMQPGPDDELLLSAGVRAAAVLATDEAGDRALIHEVVPRADRKAGNIHLFEMERAIFVAPVVVVVGVAEPFFH